ncbi:MAG: type III pantothenate kinase [Phycisphaerales bacterium]|nr:type III pantothenate kinase [Phycisphaerales bacterium]
MQSQSKPGSNENQSQVAVVALCVGNTRTRIAWLAGVEIHDPQSIENSDPSAIAAAAKELKARYAGRAFIIASVNSPVAEKLETLLTPHGDVYRIGRDLAIPITHTLEDASTVGQDRLLDALGAYAKLKEACVVVDAGTAITIDFVDGEGTFHGGVIAPGVRMMLKAMHEHTSALPDLPYEPPKPELGPFGKHTAHAMRLGVTNTLIGFVRFTVEKYAEHYQAFPPVIATGGDAALLDGDPIIDRIVTDLQLLGVAEVCRAAAEEGDLDA